MDMRLYRAGWWVILLANVLFLMLIATALLFLGLGQRAALVVAFLVCAPFVIAAHYVLDKRSQKQPSRK